jgi:methionyl-tRNA formyltransferase
MKKYKLAIAGSTNYTRQIAENIAADDRFSIDWILTPKAKKVGRKQILQNNPLAQFAQENKIETFFLDKKIQKEELLPQIENQTIDFLLVVDFGYFVPSWLLKFPQIAPLNIHPSWLPRWRGSSPGQFALLFQDFTRDFQGEKIGGKKSAVTLMEMNQGLDQGPIIHQDFFEISENWLQNDYYQAAFDLICQNLGDKIIAFAETSQKTEQTENSPTPLARRVNKDDLFIDWKILEKMISEDSQKIEIKKSEKLLQSILADENFCQNKIEQIDFVKNAAKAFASWPNLWTVVSTQKGAKRMKILDAHRADNRLDLTLVQLEGKNSCLWNEIKNFIL